MSKLTLAGNASGTGTYTIEAPNSNNSRTMLLPDSAGNLVVTQAVQTLTNKTFSGAQVFGTASLAEPTGTAPLYMARAWVNFNGTGTVAIRASGNVSSITDNGNGNYTVNFTTAMPDANYSACITARAATSNLFAASLAADVSVGSFNFITSNSSNVVTDTATVCCSVFR